MAGVITENELLELTARGFQLKDFAEHFGCSSRTIRRKLRQYRISLREKRYSSISDRQLHSTIRDLLSEGHNLGEISIDSRLKCLGFVVQRSRIRMALSQLVPKKTRQLRQISRRIYYTRAPLSMVHLDGNHKLIRWRIVIHGAIDGFSRKVIYLRPADNNRASTVLRFFKDGIYESNLPSRVRIDKGKENVGVVHYMLKRRGVGRKSVIAGKSVHNVRIERHWVDVRNNLTGAFRNCFKEMEWAGMLDHKNDIDLYCLHACFMPLLEKSANFTRGSWNLHKHRSLKHKSPNWVFEQGILHLKAYAVQHNKYFTELDQCNWQAMDEDSSDDDLDHDAGPGGVHVPRIRCPLDAFQSQSIKDLLHRKRINWKNAVNVYLKVKNLVTSMILSDSD